MTGNNYRKAELNEKKVLSHKAKPGLKVTVRNILLTRIKIANIDVKIADEDKKTNEKGQVLLKMPGDGKYTMKINPAGSLGPIGPAIPKEQKAPEYIYRPLDVFLTIKNGQVAEAKVGDGIITGKVEIKPTLIVYLQPIWMQSPNQNDRPLGKDDITLIVIHHTGTSLLYTLDTFLKKECTSAHYIINVDGQIVKMVNDSRRAFHAGCSRWEGKKSVNDFSIGIEIVHKEGNYDDRQYKALLELIESLRERYPTINKHRIVGHSDIATNPINELIPGTDQPVKYKNLCNGKTEIKKACDEKNFILGRKPVDPGQDFYWEKLEAKKLGLVPSDVTDVIPLITKMYCGFFSKYPNKSLSSNYLFCWDTIKNNFKGRLNDFLIHDLNIDWIKTAKISEINKNEYKVESKGNSILLSLDDKKTEVSLKFDDGGRDKLIVRRENKQLNIYAADNPDNDPKRIYGGRQRLEINPIKGADPPIKELQKDLDAIGYSVGINGRYDHRTEKAVLMFQKHFFSGSRKKESGAYGRLNINTAKTIKRVRNSLPNSKPNP